MLRNSSGHKATETTTEEREEEFDSDWEIVEECVRGEEACFPKWFFEYDAPLDPPDTDFSGAKPLTTSGRPLSKSEIRNAIVKKVQRTKKSRRGRQAVYSSKESSLDSDSK